MNAHVPKPGGGDEPEWEKVSMSNEVMMRRGGLRGLGDAIHDLLFGVEPQVVEIVFWMRTQGAVDVLMPAFTIRPADRGPVQ